MSSSTANAGDDRRFGRAARRLGTASIVVRAIAISFLLFFLVSREGYGNRHPFGTILSAMGLSSLGQAGLFVGFPLAFVLSVAGLFRANSGRIVGNAYSEARRWSNILMALIGFDVAVLLTAGILALLPARSEAPSVSRGRLPPRRPPFSAAAEPPPPPALALPAQGVPVTRRQVSEKLDAAKDWQGVLRRDRTALTRDVIREKLLALGQEAVPGLVRGASDPDRGLRLASLEILADLVASGRAKVDPKSRPGIENPPIVDPSLGGRTGKWAARIFEPEPPAEPTVPQRIRAMIDPLDSAPGKGLATTCIVRLKDGTRQEGELLNPSIKITTDTRKIEITRERLLALRLGDLARGEKSEALAIDGAHTGWADIASIAVKTAEKEISLPRSQVKEIEITSRRTPEQLLALYGRPGLALAYADAVQMGRNRLARKLASLLEKGRGSEAGRADAGERSDLPGAVGTGPLDKKSDLIAAGDDQGRLHVFLVFDGERIPIARHTVDAVRLLGQPAISGTGAYVGGEDPRGADGALYGIDLLTGERLWKTVVGKVRRTGPAILGDLLFVATGGTGGSGRPGDEADHGDAGLYALRIDTGRVEWFVPLAGATGDQSPSVDGDSVSVSLPGTADGGVSSPALRFRAEDGAKMEAVPTEKSEINRRGGKSGKGDTDKAR